MKVIIPVAGFGTRLRPHTLTKPKVLLNVAGKPMIHYIIEQLLKEKIGREMIFITGFLGEKIEDYLKSAFKSDRKKFRFIVQDIPKGLGHAIHCAEPAFDKNEEVLIILGDTLFDVNLKHLVNNKYGVIGTKKVDDPRRFGVVEINKAGFITRMVEKPASPKVSKSNDAIVGIYMLKSSDVLFNSLNNLIENDQKTGGEYQLTDALSLMLKSGEKMMTYNVQGWLDCGKHETILETNRYILKNILKQKKYNFKNTQIIPPVFIGKNVEIADSIIGPYTSVSDGCKIGDSIIKDSIIYNNVTIVDSEISSSVIGEHSKVHSGRGKLNLGEYSEIIQ